MMDQINLGYKNTEGIFYMKKFYFTPQQVLFYDIDYKSEESGIDNYLAGIAYEDKIICTCCGNVFMIDDIVNIASRQQKQPIYEYDYWLNLTPTIINNELPKSF